MQADTTDLDTTRDLVTALGKPQAFAHPVANLRLLETHISWIILTGDYAYKVKKPVDFGFLDFTTLEKRRFYCEEELRLNRRFAPEIYLELVAIRGSHSAPRMYGNGAILDYAIKMREFAQQDLLSSYADSQRLDADLIDAMAVTISEIHANCPWADAQSDYGSAQVVARWSTENISHLADAITDEYLPPGFAALREWHLHDGAISSLIDLRKQQGFVRECHGDLHLGNMALIDERVTLFDCIEFNPELRWIDVVSEAAFVAMDLQARGFHGYCWRFINRYLQASGDYAGVRLLRYFFVYRALVRAKVEALRVGQLADATRSYPERIKPALDYIDLAQRWAGQPRGGLILMHGLSGSGKSTVAARLAEALGAIQIRSDIERKRLFDIAANEATGSMLGEGIYTTDVSELTYRKLGELAQYVIDAGFCVIVDATFLLESQRLELLRRESTRAFTRIIIDCNAPESELRRRILQRKGDASEATLEVLARQISTREAITTREIKLARLVQVDTNGIDSTQIDTIRELLVS